jgi:hypothetical protein
VLAYNSEKNMAWVSEIDEGKENIRQMLIGRNYKKLILSVK